MKEGKIIYDYSRKIPILAVATHSEGIFFYTLPGFVDCGRQVID
jgi:hypothetical protein